jgi:hypothetical protein
MSLGRQIDELIVFVSRFQLNLHPVISLIKDIYIYIYIKANSFNGSLILNVFNVSSCLWCHAPNVLFFFLVYGRLECT